MTIGMVILGLLALLVLVAIGLALFSGSTARKIERLLPAMGRYVDVPGASLHYVELGKGNPGPPLVMIHGILAQMRNFDYALAQRMAETHHVVMFDRPGWGYSRFTGARAGPWGQGAMIAAAVEKLGLAPAVFVGHSMGGAVSLSAALQKPEAVKSLALIAPLTQPVDEPADALKGLLVPRALRSFVANVVAVPMMIRSGKTKSAMAFGPDPVPEDYATKGGGVLAVRPASFLSGTHEIEAAFHDMPAMAARYGEIGVPVAILYGREDALLEAELHGRRTAEAIPGARLTVIEGGHMPLIVRPDETEAWLRGAIG